MRKKGFTVAEVLITLAIIGVVAALTIPTLVSSNKNKVSAKTLSVAIADFENGTAAAMMKDSAGSLSETEAWKGSFSSSTSSSTLLEKASMIGQSLKVSFDEDKKNPSKFYEGGKISTIENSSLLYHIDFSSAVPFATKKGYVYFIKKENPTIKFETEAEAIAEGTALMATVGKVFIDTNGKAKPNKFAYDIFAFILGDDGKLYPYGGADVAVIEQDDKELTWDNNSSRYACTDTSKKNSGFGCTARVIDKGFEIDY